MTYRKLLLGGALLLAFAPSARAQNQAPSTNSLFYWYDSTTRNYWPDSDLKPAPFACVIGCSGGGGGGGAVTAAPGSYVNGAIVTLGNTADTAYAGSGSATDIAILKGLYTQQALASGATRTNDTATSRTQTHDDTLAVAQAGSGLKIQNGAATQITATPTQVTVPAATSTLLLAANASRKFLRIAGTNAADNYHLGYGTAASATSSPLFGSGGVLGAEQFGASDGVPTGAIYAYSVAGFTAQVLEGN